MTYDIIPDHVFPHQFAFPRLPSSGNFFLAIDWCFDNLEENRNNERWTYVALERSIIIRQPGDALLFWTRWATA